MAVDTSLPLIAGLVAALVVSGLALLHACYVAVCVRRAIAGVDVVPSLSSFAASEGPAERVLPRITIVVPACNEEASIEAALRSKLGSSYPDLEVVVVVDRSSDRTLALAERVAAEDARLKVVEVTTLPEGWLGKVHALDRGVREATGEFILFSDADVHFSVDLLERVALVMAKRGLDFVTLVPDMTPVSPPFDAVLTTFIRMLITGGRLWRVRDPESPVGVGAGLFNMARRSAFDRTPGFEWLKMEVADDVAFGQMMKQWGARCEVFRGRGDVMLPFYESLGHMIRGIEKNSYAALSRFRPGVAVTLLALLFALEIAPLALLFVPRSLGFDVVRSLSALTMVLLTGSQLIIARWAGRPLATAGFPWFGAAVLLVATARSMVITHAQGGIIWRGTFYPLAALRAGTRFRRP